MIYKREDDLDVIMYGTWFTSYFAKDYKYPDSATDLTVVNTKNFLLTLVFSPLSIWKWDRWGFKVENGSSYIEYNFMLPSCTVNYFVRVH